MKQQNIGGNGPDSLLRQLIANAIKQSGKKRLQIAEEMTAELGVRVTEAMLNDFTAKSKCAARFPAAFVKAFCKVVGSSSLQMSLLGDEALGLMKLGERVREAKKIMAQIASALNDIDAPTVNQFPPARGK